MGRRALNVHLSQTAFLKLESLRKEASQEASRHISRRELVEAIIEQATTGIVSARMKTRSSLDVSPEPDRSNKSTHDESQE